MQSQRQFQNASQHPPPPPVTAAPEQSDFFTFLLIDVIIEDITYIAKIYYRNYHTECSLPYLKKYVRPPSLFRLVGSNSNCWTLLEQEWTFTVTVYGMVVAQTV